MGLAKGAHGGDDERRCIKDFEIRASEGVGKIMYFGGRWPDIRAGVSRRVRVRMHGRAGVDFGTTRELVCAELKHGLRAVISSMYIKAKKLFC